MIIKEINVTPDMAREWLGKNAVNRNLSMRQVKKFVSDMKAGEWRNTHQNAIAFYEDGNLADGQHRLMAIEASGLTVRMMVAEGLTRKDGGMIDQGRTRSVADALKIGGMLKSEKNTSYAVAIVKLIRSAEVDSNRTMSISEVADAIETLRSGIDFSCDNLAAIQGAGLKNATLRAAVVTAYYHTSHIKLQGFCNVMVTGLPKREEDEGAVRLRNWLLVQGSPGGGKGRIDRYRTIMKYIDAYDLGKPNMRIRAPQCNFYEVGVFKND